MDAKRDYYDVLGVSRGASPEEVKRAYRRLARQHHPDVNPGDAEAEKRFKEVVEAYEVLSDPERRAQYDRFGHAGAPVMADFGFGGFSDLIEAFFGGFESRPRSTIKDFRGADLRLDLEITLEEAAFGTTKTVRVNRLTRCDECRGEGGHAGSAPVVCPLCRGEGRVRHSTGVFGMQFTSVYTCEHCQGEGSTLSDPCPSCQATGRTRKVEHLRVEIPPGVDSGYRLRLEKEGDAGLRGAPPGDLYLVVHVLSHKIFERRGTEIVCEVPLPFTVAALGGKIRVPTLGGEQELHIPAGTQTGTTFRLRGQGLPEPNGHFRGDQHVIVKVVVPARLSAKQRELLRQLAKTEKETTVEEKGLLERVKDALGGES